MEILISLSLNKNNYIVTGTYFLTSVCVHDETKKYLIIQNPRFTTPLSKIKEDLFVVAYDETITEDNCITLLIPKEMNFGVQCYMNA
jgi:hypothetical protein